jgi:hypothetical protein
VQAGGTGFVQVEAPLLVLATHRTPAVACSTAWWELSVSALEPWQDHHRGATPQARARQIYLERRVIACCTASCGVELARHQRVHQKPERCDLALRVQIGTRVRRGRRIPLHAVWRSDRDRGGWRLLHPGDAACWPAGTANAHQVVNLSNAPCTYLIFGTRMAYDTVHYPDIGKILYDEDGTWRLHRTDDGSLIREGTIEQLRPLTRWDPNADQVPWHRLSYARYLGALVRRRTSRLTLFLTPL